MKKSYMAIYKTVFYSGINKASICTLILLSISFTVSANLITNGSFESFTTCPTGSSQVSNINDWNQTTQATPDYYNACSSPGSFQSVEVPTNFAGTQTPLDGDAYTGLVVYHSFFSYREYIDSRLTQTLVAGREYSLTFFVSLAENSLWASDSIGAFFSVGPVGSLNDIFNLSFTPQIQSTTGVFLDDTVNWTAISGSFIASGGEDHITIGNFKDNSNTGISLNGGNFPTELADASYLYIDNVSLIASPVPIPAAAWLLTSGLLALFGMGYNKQA